MELLLALGFLVIVWQIQAGQEQQAKFEADRIQREEWAKQNAPLTEEQRLKILEGLYK
jgi:hypothetical protein